MQTAMGGAGDALQIVGSEAVTGMIPGFLKQDKGSYTGMAIQAGGGLLLGLLAQQFRLRFLNPRLIVAGGFIGPVRALIRQFNVPFLAPALGQAPTMQELAAYPTLEAYPEEGLSQTVDIYGTGYGQSQLM